MIAARRFLIGQMAHAYMHGGTIGAGTLAPWLRCTPSTALQPCLLCTAPGDGEHLCITQFTQHGHVRIEASARITRRGCCFLTDDDPTNRSTRNTTQHKTSQQREYRHNLGQLLQGQKCSDEPDKCKGRVHRCPHHPITGTSDGAGVGVHPLQAPRDHDQQPDRDRQQERQ